jgi:hypothetical protein
VEMTRKRVVFLATLGLFTAMPAAAGESNETELVIASGRQSNAKIIVSSSAGEWEQRAAEDLAHYIERMTGAQLPIVSERRAIDAALQTDAPLLIIGQEAHRAQQHLQDALDRVHDGRETQHCAQSRTQRHGKKAGADEHRHRESTPRQTELPPYPDDPLDEVCIGENTRECPRP